MKKKWLLISVFEREISTKQFDTLEEAQKEMRENFYEDEDIDELLEEGEAELNEMSAWANADDGYMNCDWQIVEITL